MKSARAIASAHGWKELTLPAGDFVLAGFAPNWSGAESELTVYLEGDGQAYLAPDSVSDDPTPREPIALDLAIAQPVGRATYLARPCQYIRAPGSCQPADWTNGRFSGRVIAATDVAISQLKARSGADRLILVGYSGGAGLAALVAARRHDVVRFISVAGNLDTGAWIRLHQLPPLTGSLDPVTAAPALAHLPQRHYFGSRDSNVPKSLIENFVALAADARVVEIAGFDHHCCWVRSWPDLWRAAQGAEPAPPAPERAD